MKTREEVAEFINKGGGHNTKQNSSAWHFGLQELRELTDFVYGGEPENKSEHIVTLDNYTP